MNSSRRATLCALGAAAAHPLLMPSLATAAAAGPEDESVMLVARPALRDRLYASTVLVARPVGSGAGHIGLIVNRPTPLTLGKLFPDHEPSRKVVDPVYLGGPISTRTLFVLAQRTESPGGKAMRLGQDLYLVIERRLVDSIIEAGADHARFYAGAVLWTAGELRSEMRRGFWYRTSPDADIVLRKSTAGMWEELVSRLKKDAKWV